MSLRFARAPTSECRVLDFLLSQRLELEFHIAQDVRISESKADIKHRLYELLHLSLNHKVMETPTPLWAKRIFWVSDCNWGICGECEYSPVVVRGQSISRFLSFVQDVVFCDFLFFQYVFIHLNAISS